MEAALFGFRSIAVGVAKSEDVYMPQVFAFILQLPLHPVLHRTVLLLIGAYAEYIHDHEALLQPLLAFVLVLRSQTNISLDVRLRFPR